MSKKILDDDILDQVAADAPLAVKGKKEETEVQRQVMVYDVPKAWITAVKTGAHATMSSYMKAALYEKLQRDGHL